MTIKNVPFSSQIIGSHQKIDADFPRTARLGLLHLIFDLIEKEYIHDYIKVAKELERIGRLEPTDYETRSSKIMDQAKQNIKLIINQLKWEKVYDFCERLHSNLATEVGYYDNNNNYEITTGKSKVQDYISSEIQRLFLEESLAYEFHEGQVRRRGRKHTVETITKAQFVMGDPQLINARKHYEKALYFFRNPTNPDFENCVKEAVCAVEAAGKTLFPAAKASTLGDLTKWLASNASVPKAICQTINGIYAFRSGGEGIGHGGATGGVATQEITEYVLSVCASQIIYFVDLYASLNPDVPF
jgi:AbiJ N-terminal domain 4